jgi:hypothetical protein
MNASKEPRRARGASRRAFLKTIAAGSAAALAAPALALAADEKKTAATRPRGKSAAAPAKRPAEIERGIEEQKGYLKQTLEALRGYELPANAEQAFTFVPLEAAPGGREP